MEPNPTVYLFIYELAELVCWALGVVIGLVGGWMVFR